ncbi:hypothetical protein [Pseudochelatococcus contaminans]|uniref:Uncharacterized protein n=1 Tax=Pseudochelatococcus contaminans TaxID=1538103 RepID=A0A7W5Z3N2_9HYPH|nr:hypothetical protein [Pseudochelatococcus contaminans]MBB3809560.1 hypothetical protein [Pseudochelatococcus contaminans]
MDRGESDKAGAPASQPADAIGLPVLAAVVAIAFVAMLPYFYGYRLSGDDIWFLTLAIEGRDAIISNAIHVAQEQGRIGQVLMVPLNVLGSVIAGDAAGRIGILVAYTAQLMLFAVFVAQLLRRSSAAQQVWPFLFLLLVALHPLAFSFMPPNAYPLQNTIPFIVILLARLAMLRLRRARAPCRLCVALAQAAFALGMFVSEFAVAFGTALLIAEYLARYGWARAEGRSGSSGAIRVAFAPHFLVSDAAAALAVLVPYVVFRWMFPGTYEGNSIGGVSDPARVIITVFGHVRDGTAFPRLGGGLRSASPGDLVIALMLGLAVAVALYRTSAPVLSLAAPGWTLIVSLMLAAYVTLPVAVSAKYQSACVEWGACGYLDSRMSYLAVTVALMAAVAAGWRLCGQARDRRRFLIGACAALGVMAALVSIYNAGKARDMRHVHEVWLRADALVCAGPIPPDGMEAWVQQVDPSGFVVVNPPNQVADFWRVYAPWRAQRICQ